MLGRVDLPVCDTASEHRILHLHHSILRTYHLPIVSTQSSPLTHLFPNHPLQLTEMPSVYGTQHHCPEKDKCNSPCRRDKKHGICSNHQMICSNFPKCRNYFLKSEGCRVCKKRAESKENKEEKEKTHGKVLKRG